MIFSEKRFATLRTFIRCCFIVFLLCGCGAKTEFEPIDPNTEILDVARFDQHLASYAARLQDKGKKPLISERQQAEETARFLRLFFAPWDTTTPQATDKAFLEPYIGSAKKKPVARGYVDNENRWTQEAWEIVVKNVARETFPSLMEPAVVVQETELRHVPTALPRYTDPTKPGSGAPFDMFRATYLAIGTPVLLTHVSLDGNWVFVENALIPGWVPRNSVATVNKGFQALYRNGTYMAFLREGVSLVDSQQNPRATSRIGMIVPRSPFGEAVLIPVATPTHKARLVACRPADSEYGIYDTSLLAPLPLPLTAQAIAAVGQAFMGQAYGWGGEDGNRDCSLMLRDLFMPFGIWLPRNSYAQSRAWSFTSFKGLTLTEKIEQIRTAQPFATLLWLPGHIALYIGEEDGEPLMFHTLWGIRTKDAAGGDTGRHVVGKAVISTTKPGVELPHVSDPRGLLQRIGGMSHLSKY